MAASACRSCPAGWNSPPAWPGWPACRPARAICARSAPQRRPADPPHGWRSRSTGPRWGRGSRRGAAPRDAPAARLAIECSVPRLRRGIAAMPPAMNGLDLLVFTGGVGEHAPDIRAAAAAGVAFLGVAVDPGRNAAVRADGDITARGAPARAVVVTAREDVEIARQTRATLTRSRT